MPSARHLQRLAAPTDNQAHSDPEALAVIFGFFKGSKGKRPYPRITPEMIQPAGEPLSTADAKAVFKSYMVRIRFLDEREVSEHVGYLTDEIKQTEAALKDDLDEPKRQLAEARASLKALQKRLAAAKTKDETATLEAEIEEAEFEVQAQTQGMEEAAKALAAFKADKRQFIVDYINQQLED